jgi:hypothetical protein
MIMNVSVGFRHFPEGFGSSSVYSQYPSILVQCNHILSTAEVLLLLTRKALRKYSLRDYRYPALESLIWS